MCGFRYYVPTTKDFVKNWKRSIKHTSSLLLVYTVYGAFCQMFYDGVDANVEDFFIVLGLDLLIHFVFVCGGFLSVNLFSSWTRRDKVAILFCTTQKTAAMGIPLINTMFENSDNLGLYQVPLLM